MDFTWEVYAVMVPTYYGITQAKQAVIQMDKKTNDMSVIGDYISFRQFKLPNRFLRETKMIGEIKLLLIKRILTRK
jgi:hypothetical protein